MKQFCLNSFRDKFFFHDLNGTSNPYLDKFIADKYYKNIGKEIIRKFRKTKPSNPKYEKVPTFREFVEYLVEIPLHKWHDMHWILMYLLCLPCHIEYNIIGRTNNLRMDSENIFKMLKINMSLPHTHESQLNTSTDTRVERYYGTLNKTLMEKLIDIYKLDFYLFGYNKEEYWKFIED